MLRAVHFVQVGLTQARPNYTGYMGHLVMTFNLLTPVAYPLLDESYEVHTTSSYQLLNFQGRATPFQRGGCKCPPLPPLNLNEILSTPPGP